jgi:TFIIF-interacting CTD phosphatase-like protein
MSSKYSLYTKFHAIKSHYFPQNLENPTQTTEIKENSALENQPSEGENLDLNDHLSENENSTPQEELKEPPENAEPETIHQKREKRRKFRFEAVKKWFKISEKRDI